MSPDTRTMIVSLADIIATLVSSALGLHFTARARSAPLRELLYEKQMGVALGIIRLVGRLYIFARILADPSSEHREQASEDMHQGFVRLSKFVDTSAALMPTEFFIETSRLSRDVGTFIEDCDKGADVTLFPAALRQHSAKLAVLARIHLGIDELSQESASLYGNDKRFSSIASLTPDEIDDQSRKNRV